MKILSVCTNRKARLSAVVVLMLALWCEAGAAVVPTGPPQARDQLDRWYYRATNQIHHVRFLGGFFIGLGDHGTLVTSPDGQDWTVRDSGTTNRLQGVAWGTIGLSFTPKFVVVGAKGTILTSADAIAWTSVSATTQDLNDVAWNGTRFAITTTAKSSAEPNILLSSNGETWSGASFVNNPDPGFPFFTSSIGTAGTYFITAGGSQFAYNIWRSSTGAAWEKVGFADAVVEGIASGNARTIVVGWEGWPRVSTNKGATWFPVASDVIASNAYQPPWYEIPMVGSDICFGNGMFVTPRGFRRNGFLTTEDGINWTKRDLFIGALVESVAYGSGTFVVACSGDAYPAGIYRSARAATPFLTTHLEVEPKAFVVDVSGEIGRSYVLQTSHDMQNWTNHITYTSTNPITRFVEPLPASTPSLFYRSISP